MSGIDHNKDDILISIPIEMEIKVAILRDTDEAELHEDTKTLIKCLDSTEVKDMETDEPASDSQGVRRTRKLSQSVRKGHEFSGINITVSKKVSEDPRLKSFKSVLNQPLPLPPSHDLPSSCESLYQN